MPRLGFRFCFLLVVLASTSARAGESGWRAGTARAAITPERPIWLAGYGHRDRPAEGKVHDLWLKALALEDASGNRAVLLASDLLGLPGAVHERLRKALREKDGLEPAQVLLTSSHTHSGPVLGDALHTCYPIDDAGRAAIEEYTRGLEGRIVDVVGEALSRLAPATVSVGAGLATFAVNRRNNREADVPRLRAAGTPPQGPSDPAVPVLAVRGASGELLAVAFGYACHNTTLDGYAWCGDYAGFAQMALERAFPGAMAMFWAGCGADQNPIPRRSLALCERYGNELAASVVEALARPVRSLKPRLRSAFEVVPLDYERSPTREELEAGARSQNAIEARWAKALLETLDAGRPLARSYPYPVQAWRLGDEVLWIALGGEVVVDYALRFRRELGPETWVTAYANDVMAYIPSLRVREEGGYESGAFQVYGVPAFRWAGDVEDRVAGAVHRLARELTVR